MFRAGASVNAARAGSNPARKSGSARVTALRLLAMRRLTEAQLWKKLNAKGYDDTEIAVAIDACKRDGYLDDRLFATLYIEGPRKAVGDARLVAELVKRGIDRGAAHDAVAAAPADQTERIRTAYEKLRRTRPNVSFQSVARGLERLGFPTSLIYRELRERAQLEFRDHVPEEGDAIGEQRDRGGNDIL